MNARRPSRGVRRGSALGVYFDQVATATLAGRRAGRAVFLRFSQSTRPSTHCIIAVSLVLFRSLSCTRGSLKTFSYQIKELLGQIRPLSWPLRCCVTVGENGVLLLILLPYRIQH